MDVSAKSKFFIVPIAGQVMGFLKNAYLAFKELYIGPETLAQPEKKNTVTLSEVDMYSNSEIVVKIGNQLKLFYSLLEKYELLNSAQVKTGLDYYKTIKWALAAQEVSVAELLKKSSDDDLFYSGFSKEILVWLRSYSQLDKSKEKYLKEGISLNLGEKEFLIPAQHFQNLKKPAFREIVTTATNLAAEIWKILSIEESINRLGIAATIKKIKK